ncbi:AAA domain-containing protein, putative AbiEii toxin, Type IV TA system [Paenibacillus tianmuensis]|uniref:AAA domain-containing protein, putative AbiEii toxin, Type IV TA system n=2 Tax=Paenibacillus tianmuensis TaxID=624147 RepID=A0A1G4U0Q7_9BACL|nr:AAA domain-containing protein, putative AbiEii toxin, Type IV TA system [Paenibacillus tianmuensis]
MYTLCYVNESGERIHLGSVKIGERNVNSDTKRPNIPKEFDSLDDGFFSLGQDVGYYSSLNELGDDFRQRVLRALNDMALLPDVYERVRRYRVTTSSITRNVRHTSVVGQYRRLANGNSKLTPYKFTYTGPKIKDTNRVVLEFEVTPDSNPPTNMHVLIGRNAVGKTHMINNMVSSLISTVPSRTKNGYFSTQSDEIANDELFANVVSVSFSAFDPGEPMPDRRNRQEGTPYTYIGLKQVNKPPKSPENLKYDFANSLDSIKSSNKTVRWLRAVEMLCADPIFSDSNVPSILERQEADDFLETLELDSETNGPENMESHLLKRRAQKFFHRLSSGHKIVLLTLTRLVETLEERTLVLLDEPEAHLHPPLLSAFIRALSDLLIQRNAVAIIATHSPVILQEVPRSCVWKLRRNGKQLTYHRTGIETFGENIGELTSEIFELEVVYSGFYKMLRDAVEKYGDYDTIIEDFNNELGWEAKAILRGLLNDALREEA